MSHAGAPSLPAVEQPQLGRAAGGMATPFGPGDLPSAREAFRSIGDELQAQDRLRGSIAAMSSADLDCFHRTVARTRGEFSELRLALLRLLDIRAVGCPGAEGIRATIERRYPYAGVRAAEAILAMLDGLLAEAGLLRTARQPLSSPSEIAEALGSAMRDRKDNKKSAAAKIDVDVKTLDRLLQARPVKGVVRGKAIQYIQSSPRYSRSSKRGAVEIDRQ